ncbi:hypothetical protein HYFRA_00007309 [Hymenoscyphus fraxineus]|uniref:HAT C-terminal dimerisation domain-containing protein n=1 Tax=Hymenoscyphus fraxineus TaxID=746836 RepID=A0A9N9PLP9_9HELO|nr:hypothetical protein HYFRA_00007309 [Hymenoscyphus fraxineus]
MSLRPGEPIGSLHSAMLGKQYDYPILFQMARDYLGIPATLAPSKRVFSNGGRVITKDRCRISGKRVRWIICLRDWGIIPEEVLDELTDEEIEAIVTG